MDIEHVWEASAQMAKQARFVRNSAKNQMLIGTAHDGMKDRIAAPRHTIDFYDMALGAFAVILGKFPERAFRRTATARHT
jgi:hypothetical protein